MLIGFAPVLLGFFVWMPAQWHGRKIVFEVHESGRFLVLFCLRL